MKGETFALVTAMAAAGLLLGLCYFAALRRTAALYGARRGAFAPLALTLGRIAAISLFLLLAAKLGALSLLAAFAGFFLSRAIAVGATGRARH